MEYGKTIIQKAATGADETRLAEIAYHRKQNRAVIYCALPGMLFYAGVYYYLSNTFQLFIFVLMIVNSVFSLVIGNRIKDMTNMILYKRIAAGIWFALLAVNLLTGLWDKNIYFIVMPWIFLYPMAAIMFFGRKLGFIVGAAFTVVAVIFFLINPLPPLDRRNTFFYQFNSVFTLLSILLISVIYEKIRMKVQDELAISEHQYKLAEQCQRKTNTELQTEIERRKLSERALADSESHYRALFEESVVPLWEEDWSQTKALLDALPQTQRDHLASYLKEHPQTASEIISTMRVKTVNRATLRLFRVDSLQELMQKLLTLLPVDPKNFIIDRLASLYQERRYNAEIQGQNATGRQLHLLVSSTVPAGYEKSWENIFSSVYDATQRVEMERQKSRLEREMQNALKIQAIATLAGGIAHQFNNALAVIYASLDLLEMNAQIHTETLKVLTALKSSASRMSRLTDQLLAYAEGGKYQPQSIALNELVTDVIGSPIMMRDSAIDVACDLSDNLSSTTGDITQIRMVLEVILSNAFEAMPQGGRVKISTGQTFLDASEDSEELVIKPGPYVYMLVADNGVGMNEETLQRIFEPFFTTKIYGRGLGMAAAYGIVKNHDGGIRVKSAPGKGTTVTVYLPAVGHSGN